MKTNIFKYSILVGFLFFLVACSTKNNSFLSRNSHALSTKYNILYNGQIGLDKGIEGIKSKSTDDFWKRLPIERMQISDDPISTEKTKNTDFELAETKATKAIQKHSMNIDGKERNFQIDEAYLLLGKSRYYDQRFLPALDAFNYILYKYPTSSRIYEAKIWREKTNMRLGNDALVVKNINKLLKEQKLKKQVLADANALLSEAFLNLEETDSAVAKLNLAVKYTKQNNERARYRFILGQLYEELGKKDSALYSYESLIKMNRKAERKYVIQAHARKAQLFDYEKGDSIAFLKRFNKLIIDRENRPFLDVLYYQKGVFYDKTNHRKQAAYFYNRSLKKATVDQYLIASNYRNLGNMYFKNAGYATAAKYYDSTLVKMEPKTREYIRINKIRKDLDDVILYESIATRNDSILSIVLLSQADRISYFENYIVKLKAADEAKRILEEKEKQKQENIARNSSSGPVDNAISAQNPGTPIRKSALSPPTMTLASTSTSVFYFYNPSTVSFGKVEFKKIWGERSSKGNWRLSEATSNVVLNDTLNSTAPLSDQNESKGDKIIAEYTPDFYIKQLPTAKITIDSIGKERNTAYYQLGVIYKEKFKEYELASMRLEQLLQNNPEEKLILPTLYNLYKIYQITDNAKAELMKSKINAQFPDSRYAQIINNKNLESGSQEGTPDDVYKKLYTLYTQEQFVTVLEKDDALIAQYSGEEILPKLELLRANTIGKLRGLLAYKNALQYVADTYSNTEEGKKAQEILTNQIPVLEKIDFGTVDTKNWKILYKVVSRDDKDTKNLEDKIKKCITNSGKKLTLSYDVYLDNESFMVIHGMYSQVEAQNMAVQLKENKEYNIENQPIIISNENYKVIQIKKNLNDYLALKN